MAEKEKLRLFLGSFIELELVKSDFDHPVRFVKPKNLHITWKFFGETEKTRIPEILNRIEKITSKINDISIKFNRFELWPGARYPRLLVLAGDDLNGNATQLYEAFNGKKFNPHITIARFKLKKKPAQTVVIPEGLIFKEKQVNFKEISLLKSTLSPEGSIYEKIKTFQLQPTRP